MIVTGAGPGIMAAGMEGAGPRPSHRREHPPAVRAGRQPDHRPRREARLDEVLLHPQADADQGVEGVRVPARRLRHARRDLRAAHADARPARAFRCRSCCSTCPAARSGTRAAEFIETELVDRVGLVDPTDMDLFLVTDNVDAARARRSRASTPTSTRCATSATFSCSGCGRCPTTPQLDDLNERFGHLCASGTRSSAPRPCPTRSPTTTLELPRVGCTSPSASTASCGR